MDFGSAPYEVEIRFHFESYEEACERIPFLDSCLKEKKTWDSRIFGEDIFHSGRLLRIGVLSPDNNPVYYLCMKGPDTGSFANIRQEAEEIVTGGVKNSTILGYLGGRTDLATPGEIAAELERLGHHPFMSFAGRDTYGDCEPYGISIKWMDCPYIGFPLMAEFEKIASTETEAKQFEEDLKNITEELKLGDRLVREEPPTLRYETLFGTENPEKQQ